MPIGVVFAENIIGWIFCTESQPLDLICVQSTERL